MPGSISPGGRASAAPAPAPLPARPRPGRAPARPPARAAPGTAAGGGGSRHPLASPAAGIYLAGEPALPGPAPTSNRLSRRSGRRGTERSSPPSPSPQPAGRAAAATALPLPQSLALEAAILARAPRPPPRRSRPAARGRHGTGSPDVLRAASLFPPPSCLPSFLPSSLPSPLALPCPALFCGEPAWLGAQAPPRRPAGEPSLRGAARASPRAPVTGAGPEGRLGQLKTRSTLFNCAHYLRGCKGEC